MKKQRIQILLLILTLWLTSVTVLLAAPEVPPILEQTATVPNAPTDTQDYPPDPTSDIAWSAGTSDVADIEMSFNNARAAENSQLGLSIPMLTVPTQAEWDGMSNGEKALWLINRERVDRGIAELYSLETNVNGIAQYYAQYLLDNDAWGHTEDGNNPWERLNTNATINNCHDYLSVAENLAVFVTTADNINLPIERSVYNWMYDDSGSNWGHRHAILWYPYSDNSGDYGAEGFLGIGRANGGPYQGPFSREYPFAEMIVMNIFDPCDTWDYSTAIPPRPEMLATTLTNTNAITMTWSDKSMNEDGFKVERTTDGATWTQINTVNTDTTTYSDSDLTCNTPYTYRVRAYNTAADSAHTNLITPTTAACPATAPDAPTNLSVTQATTTSLSLTWTDNSDNEDGFTLECSPDGSTWTTTSNVNPNTTTYDDSNLTCESTYYYRIFAHNTISNSAYSNIVSGTTGMCPLMLPSNPSGLTSTPLSPTSLRLNWIDNSDNEDGFRIERSPDGTLARMQVSAWTQVGTVLTNITAFTDTGLTENTTYYYRIFAFNNDGDSSTPTDATQGQTQALIGITKHADTGGLNPVPLGSIITYTLTIINNGTEILNTITISDPLPTEVTFGTWLGHTGSAILPPPGTILLPPVTVLWQPGDLAPSETLTLTFNVHINNDEANAGNTVINTAYAVADNASRVSAIATCTIAGGTKQIYLPLVVRSFTGSTPINQPPNVPANPTPADGTADQDVNVTLSWSGGDPNGDTVSYDIYLEANDNTPDVLIANDHTDTTYPIGTLMPETLYYWQIIATDDAGATTTGPVWEFTTATNTPIALPLIPFDANTNDVYGPSSSVTNYGKSPEIIVASNGTALDVLAQDYDETTAWNAILLHIVASGDDYVVTQAITDTPMLDRVMGLANDAAGNRYYATGVDEDAVVDPDYPPLDTYRTDIVRVIKLNAAGDVQFNIDLDIARHDFNSNAEMIINPMVAASARLAVGGDEIALVHGINTDPDWNIGGARHQKALSTRLNATTGAVTRVSSVWVSHSFDQRLLYDGNDILEHHLGDAYPRYIVFARNHASYPLFHIKGDLGENNTRTRLGNVALIENDADYAYIALFATESTADTGDTINGPRNLGIVRVKESDNSIDPSLPDVLTVVSKDESQTNRLKWLTQYSAGSNLHAERPKLIGIGNDQYIVLWEEWLYTGSYYDTFNGVYGMIIDDQGNTIQSGTFLTDAHHLHRGDDAFFLNNRAAWMTGNATTQELYIHFVNASLDYEMVTVE